MATTGKRAATRPIPAPHEHSRWSAHRDDPLRDRRRCRATNPRTLVLAVHLADDVHEWRAIGGGATVEEALAFAIESAPDGPQWRVINWNHLYGD